MSHTIVGNAIKQYRLTDSEYEFVSACLLGDGTLTKSGKLDRFRVEHSMRQLEYLWWKYRALKRLCITPPQLNAAHRSIRFGTIGHPDFTAMRRAWYAPSKTVAQELVLTPQALAIWFMDDGTRHNRTVDISVYCFSDQDITALRSQMARLGVATTMNGDSRGYRIYVRQRSYPVFKTLVTPYMQPCMAYKLP